MIASLSRQVFFQLPLMLLFPLVWGLNGVLYAGPVADVSAVLLCSLLVRKAIVQFNDKAVRMQNDNNQKSNHKKI